MKITEEITIKEKKVKEIICDKCNCNIGKPVMGFHEHTIILKKKSLHYPGHDIDKIEIDLCKDCFDDFKQLLIMHNYL